MELLESSIVIAIVKYANAGLTLADRVILDYTYEDYDRYKAEILAEKSNVYGGATDVDFVEADGDAQLFLALGLTEYSRIETELDERLA